MRTYTYIYNTPLSILLEVLLLLVFMASGVTERFFSYPSFSLSFFFPPHRYRCLCNLPSFFFSPLNQLGRHNDILPPVSLVPPCDVSRHRSTVIDW